MARQSEARADAGSRQLHALLGVVSQRSTLLLSKEAPSDGVIEWQFWSTGIVVGHPGRILGDQWERLRTTGPGRWPCRQEHFSQSIIHGMDNTIILKIDTLWLQRL
jgi:hypothetical protein